MQIQMSKSKVEVDKHVKVGDKTEVKTDIFAEVASKGLAGILAIAVAESIFWALGVPLSALWYKVTTGEWIDFTTVDGQIKAAGKFTSL